ncbi:MAG: hypothetical protein HXX19_11820 [Rhodoferax sp.]|nr:hypothetical protein [Rhodoferax sp.]
MNFEELTDDQLRSAADTAESDLCLAASTMPNSEWHEACFAGLWVLCDEMTRRGMVAKGAGVPQ